MAAEERRYRGPVTVSHRAPAPAHRARSARLPHERLCRSTPAGVSTRRARPATDPFLTLRPSSGYPLPRSSLDPAAEPHPLDPLGVGHAAGRSRSARTRRTPASSAPRTRRPRPRRRPVATAEASARPEHLAEQQGRAEHQERQDRHGVVAEDRPVVVPQPRQPGRPRSRPRPARSASRAVPTHATTAHSAATVPNHHTTGLPSSSTWRRQVEPAAARAALLAGLDVELGVDADRAVQHQPAPRVGLVDVRAVVEEPGVEGVDVVVVVPQRAQRLPQLGEEPVRVVARGSCPSRGRTACRRGAARRRRRAAASRSTWRRRSAAGSSTT